MKFKLHSVLIAMAMLCIQPIYCVDNTTSPVTPNASPEAKALLSFLYSISGKYTLTGQHSYPNTKGRNYEFAAKYIGKTPVIYSSDWGFAKDSDSDSHLARPNIVEEAKLIHKQGGIVTICWHAVPPTADEPVTFSPSGDKVNPDSLNTIQGQLLDRQFKDLLTPGTKMYKHWCQQVDTIAFYLKKLQDAHVPIIWRPYHEMNGSWFWWGGRRGQYSTKALYVQIYDRLVKYHKLNNLIWLWSVDRPNNTEMQFSNYYPGDKYVDIIGLDVYGRDFNQVYYDSLVVISKGKPMALAEVGNPPSPEILKKQPRWVYYSTWAGMVRNTSKKEYSALLNYPRVLNMEDSAYRNAIGSYRFACGFQKLATLTNHPDFSGEWVINEEKSLLDNNGIGQLPYKLKIKQTENKISIQRTHITEFTDDRITDEKYIFGQETKSEFWNAPKITNMNWSSNNDTLKFDSKITFNRGGKTIDMVSNEGWVLQNNKNCLLIKQNSTSPWGKQNITIVFDKIGQ